MGFGEEDNNVDDCEDVLEDEFQEYLIEEEEETRATTPMITVPKAAAIRSSSYGVNWPDMKDIYTPGEGFLPAFPAGRLPFILCSLTATFSLSAILLFYIFVSKGLIKLDESETDSVHKDAEELGLH
mmetsp:Transcript_20611/g.24397  ORF Transcript_20611/g.24397 Transcript_20611/m.24397 type:complete len:127 (+) Transcript_20611:94-474(+)